MTRQQCLSLVKSCLEGYAMIKYEKTEEGVVSLGNDHFLLELEKSINQRASRRKRKPRLKKAA